MTNFKCHGEITTDDEGLHVTVMWDAPEVDRPVGGGWGLRNTPANRRLAARLVEAVNAGVAHEPTEVKRDIFDNTYVATNVRVFGRSMNADLKRLGF